MKRFEITPGFILLLALLLFNGGMLLPFAASLALHELAHVTAALLLGGSVSSCRLSLSGGYISVSRLSYGREALAVAAGPAISLIAAFAASWCGAYMLAGINLSFGVYNLLPARCLDGGRLVEILLTRNGGTAERTLRALTFISAFVMLVPLGIAFGNGVRNWSLIIFAVLLLIS